MRLDGMWYNELGSTMTIQIAGNQITGTYQTAVGDAAGQYTLAGSFDMNPSPSGPSAGWVVTWANQSGNSNSVTTWCGQLQDINGSEVLTAMWLLTGETAPNSDWQSTIIGKDVFTRIKPNQEQMMLKAKFAPWSHPVKRPRKS
jgi:hypothetical protein